MNFLTSVSAAVLFIGTSQGGESTVANHAQPQIEASACYKRTFRVNTDKLSKALGLNPDLLKPGAIHLSSRFDQPQVVGTGVLAPDDAEPILPFSPVLKINQAVRRFLEGKGVDFSKNSVFVHPDTGKTDVQGNLEHVIFVGSLLAELH